MEKKRKKITLSEIATLYDSLHKTPKYSENGYPMVRVTDVRSGYLDLSETKKVSKEIYQEFTKKYKPRTGDIVFSRVGSYGNSSYVNKDENFCLGQNTVCISPNSELINSFYLYSCLNSSEVKQQIDALVGGASQPTISLKNINLLEIPYPSLYVQNKIADIISTYDRLIENNTRRIKILEEMARSLYDEWFIRYPTEATENKILKDVCELIVDCEHKTAPTQATGYPSIRTPNIGKGRLLLDNVNRVSEETYIAWTKRATPQTGDLILAREAPVGNVAIVPRNLKVCLGQRTVLIRADESQVKPYYLLFLLLSRGIQNKILSLSNGATVHHLNMKDIRNLELPEIHSLSRQNEINSILSTYYELIFNLTEKIRNLHQTRDLLLPKLISGDIDVEKLDVREEGAISSEKVIDIREGVLAG